MKCPYCEKEINFEEMKEIERKNREKKTKDKLNQILYKIKKGECSISNLQKQTGIKRSTLNYYLKILEKGEFIVRKRIEKKATGRPTLISLDVVKFKERKKKLEKEISEHLKHPIIKEIINNLNKNILEEQELFKKINTGDKQYLITPFIDFLIKEGLIVRMYKLTSKGEEFLKKFSKKT